jgi:isopentenyl-diphosphate delta-isomerase
MEHVILVDTNDREIGTMEKMEAHRKGALHRAFSIMVYNSQGDVLLQKRAKGKYHSGGLWTNACCSHPRPGDAIEETTRKKLMAEMGLDILPVYSFKFIYKANVDNGLIEHEFDHVFLGTSDKFPVIDTQEVEEWKFVPAEDLLSDVLRRPGNYTPWFRLILNRPEFLNSIVRTE